MRGPAGNRKTSRLQRLIAEASVVLLFLEKRENLLNPPFPKREVIRPHLTISNHCEQIRTYKTLV